MSDSLRTFTAWLMWKAYYLCRATPRSLETYLTRGMRTRWPWRKFRPSAWHNDDGNQWHVYFTDERSFTTRRTISVECHIGRESGDIVGFNVWDEILQAKTLSGARKEKGNDQ